MRRAILDHTIFDNSKVIGVDFREAYFNETSFIGALYEYALFDFDSVTLYEKNIENINILC